MRFKATIHLKKVAFELRHPILAFLPRVAVTPNVFMRRDRVFRWTPRRSAALHWLPRTDSSSILRDSAVKSWTWVGFEFLQAEGDGRGVGLPE
jgi:hypothetical protein